MKYYIFLSFSFMWWEVNKNHSAGTVDKNGENILQPMNINISHEILHDEQNDCVNLQKYLHWQDVQNEGVEV